VFHALCGRASFWKHFVREIVKRVRRGKQTDLRNCNGCGDDAGLSGALSVHWKMPQRIVCCQKRRYGTGRLRPAQMSSGNELTSIA